ncbi:MAG: metallophosphoesterase family protein [Flavobacterium sp.]
MKQNIFFTADHHFGHANIIKFSQRPFVSLDDMDGELIRRWNERVKPTDIVYHLGDIVLSNTDRTKLILDRLNGTICLIKGNHDSSALGYPKRFHWIKDYYELNVDDADAPNGKQKIMLMHYAMRVWRSDFRGTWHLYGHSHGSLPDDPKMRSFDVGVDCHDFYPLSYEQVKEIILKKDWVPPFGEREL